MRRREAQHQARLRKHSGTAPAANRPMRVEHEYAREGACTYIAAWDVHRAKVFATCIPISEIAHFDGLVADVMAQPPYDRARRVFWIMDNASIHRGQRCVDRIRQQWPVARVLHTPIHASWLNQVEVDSSRRPRARPCVIPLTGSIVSPAQEPA